MQGGFPLSSWQPEPADRRWTPLYWSNAHMEWWRKMVTDFRRFETDMQRAQNPEAPHWFESYMASSVKWVMIPVLDSIYNMLAEDRTPHRLTDDEINQLLEDLSEMINRKQDICGPQSR